MLEPFRYNHFEILPFMSTRESSSDCASLSQGPSERFERWGQGRRRSAYRAWPPANARKYPMSKRYHMCRRMIFETVEGSNSGEDSERAIVPDDDSLKARWQELAERKLEIYDTRCKIKRAKSRVEHARQERDTADNVFMSALRPTQAGLTNISAVPSTSSLQGQFQRMQLARDTYQQYEAVVVNLEKSLAGTQDELDFLERRLINSIRPLVGDGTKPNAPKTRVPEQPQSDLLKGLEIEPEKISHPQYQRLLMALGSLSLTRRRHTEILAQKIRLEEQKRLYLTFEKYHPEALQYISRLELSDMEFLEHFETQQSQISVNARSLRKEIARLTQLCWERNLISQYTPLEEVLSWYPDDFCIDLDLGNTQIAAASTEPTEFSILLSKPSHLLGEFPITAEAALKRATSIPEGQPHRLPAIASAAKEITIQNMLSDAEDTPNFINRWLLQNLRTSRRQVGTLYSAHLTSGKSDIFDKERWQWDVLHGWWQDEVQMRSLEHFKPVHTSWLSAPHSPPSWLSEAVLYTWDSDASHPQFEMTECEQADDICQTGL